jgi:DNA-binding transcriptional ArsR family regulator
MPLPDPLPDELAELIAERFRVLGEPTRIKLLDRLRDGEATVHELAVSAASTQQNVSKHLALLRQAGIVSRRKHGTSAYYAVADHGVFELCEQVCGRVQEQARALRELVGEVGA